MNAVVVIADDLSGAAELAGVAWRHGLNAEVQTTFSPASLSEVICVDTNTRTASTEEATQRVVTIMREVIAAKPAWIFKKCDSVLRGSVAAEAQQMARIMGAGKILLVPANPSRGRIIRDGNYFIDGQPLHETAFARDPHAPRRSSRVLDLLGTGADRIDVPDVVTADDVIRLAQATDAKVLPVGAADFFAALLRVRLPQTSRQGTNPVVTPQNARSRLLVCGSAFAWPERRRDAEREGIPVFIWPHDPQAIVARLRSTGRVLIGIGEVFATYEQKSEELTNALADSVERVLGETSVDLVLLEGGATAAAVMNRMKWSSLRATAGVDDTLVEFIPTTATRPATIIKPGSYRWPVQVWP